MGLLGLAFFLWIKITVLLGSNLFFKPLINAKIQFLLHFVGSGSPTNYPTILPLEYKCFEAASIPNLLQGMLYICPLFYKNSLFVRYIATGTYRGILPKVLDMLQKETNLPPSKIFPWQLYTPKDLSFACWETSRHWKGLWENLQKKGWRSRCKLSNIYLPKFIISQEHLIIF